MDVETGDLGCTTVKIEPSTNLALYFFCPPFWGSLFGSSLFPSSGGL